MIRPPSFQGAVSRYEQVVLTPVERLASGSVPFRFCGFAASGEPLAALRLRRGDAVSDDGRFAPPTEVLFGEMVYGGVLFAQWGHFLLETLARLWFLKSCDPAVPILWHAMDQRKGFWRWQAELMEVVGLQDRDHRFVTVPTLVPALTVPEPGYVLLREFAERQVQALGCYPFGAALPGRRMWLSRARLKARTIVGEAEIEAELAKSGWTIVVPEQLSVREQLAALAGAEAIAGFEGSAFHTLVLFDQVPSKVRIVARPEGIGGNYEVIARAKSFDQRVCTSQVDKVAVSSRGASLIVSSPEDIVAFVTEGRVAPREEGRLPVSEGMPRAALDRVKALRAEAWRLFGEKAFAEAEGLARAVLAEVPDDAGMLRCRAEIALAMRDLPGALELARQAWEQRSATADQALLLGSILLRLNQPAAVLDVVASAKERLGDARALLRPHVEALRRSGRHHDAAAAFDAHDARDLTPQLQLLRSLVLVECERYAEAIQQLCDLLERVDPYRTDLGGIVNVIDILRQRHAIGPGDRRLVRLLSRLPPHFRLAWLVAPAPGDPAASADADAPVIVPGQAVDPRISGAFRGWARHPALSFARSFRSEQDIRLHTYRDVYLHVFESGFFVLDRDFNPLPISYPYALRHHVDMLRAHEAPTLLGRVFYAGDRLAPRNYCHWIADYLPRILIAQDACPHMTIHVPRYEEKSFQRESLAFFGVEPAIVRPLRHGFYRCEELSLLDSSTHRFQRYFQHGNAAYAQPLLRRLPHPSGVPTERLWLTRGETKIRHLLNEAEVHRLVEHLGFRPVNTGIMPFAEQVRLMMSATHVAGPHGAAFQNIIFCREGTAVTEFFPARYGTPAFAVMAALRNLRYRPWLAEAAGAIARVGQERQTADFSADLPMIEAGIQAMLADDMGALAGEG